MSEPSAVKRLQDELDEVLRQQIRAKDQESKIRRELTQITTLTSANDEAARRLRCAIFVLEGKAADAGKANAANSERLRELRNEDR